MPVPVDLILGAKVVSESRLLAGVQGTIVDQNFKKSAAVFCTGSHRRW